MKPPAIFARFMLFANLHSLLPECCCQGVLSDLDFRDMLSFPTFGRKRIMCHLLDGAIDAIVEDERLAGVWRCLRR
jgi:hypothetical protein